MSLGEVTTLVKVLGDGTKLGLLGCSQSGCLIWGPKQCKTCIAKLTTAAQESVNKCQMPDAFFALKGNAPVKHSLCPRHITVGMPKASLRCKISKRAFASLAGNHAVSRRKINCLHLFTVPWQFCSFWFKGTWGNWNATASMHPMNAGQSRFVDCCDQHN